MNYEEFIKTYNGKNIDYDGAYGVQCVDLIKLYLDKVFNIKIGAIGNAEAYWNRFEEVLLLKNNFDKIKNTPTFIPKKGDIMVWNKNVGDGNGHVAICTGEGTTKYFYSYDQNWNGKAMKKVKHTYKNVYGVLRAKKLDIKYRVHIQNLGWQEIKKNGELAGTERKALRIEAVQIYSSIPLKYRVHIENIGWSEWVSQNNIAGTTGKALRIEAIEIISTKEISAIAHVQNIGWQEEKKGKEIVIGTIGKALRLEAIKLKFL